MDTVCVTFIQNAFSFAKTGQDERREWFEFEIVLGMKHLGKRESRLIMEWLGIVGPTVLQQRAIEEANINTGEVLKCCHS